MGKGSTKKSSKQKMANERLKRVQELTRGLEAAIDNNDTDKAQHFVKELTLQCVSCRLDVKLKDQSQVDKDKEFSLKVNIEDKESSGSSIMLKVRGSDTIRDLKNRMLIKHMFPVEVQYWIIGKRIPPDNETLEKCRIQTHGYTAFLYLITAKSAGIDKTEFMRKQELLKNPDYVQGAMAAVSPLDDRQTLARQTSKCTSGSSTPGLLSGPSPSVKTKKDQDTFFDNINMSKTGKSTKEKFQQQSFKPPPQVPLIEDYLNELAMNQSLAGAMAAPVIPVSMSQQRVAVMHPQEDDESSYGWACPVCTYVNQPTRPGCELCAADRPDDYEVPEGYVVTEDEKKRLDREALIENQTREVQKHGRRERQYDNSSERELDDLLQFHEAIQHTIHKMSTPTQPHTTQSVTPKMRQSVPQNLQYVSPIRHRQSPTEINFDDEPTST